MPSPLINNDPSIVMEDCIVFIPPDDVYSTPPPPPTSQFGRPLHPLQLYTPHTTTMEGKIHAVQTDPRTNYLINMSKIQQLDNDIERFDAAIEQASRSLQSNSKGEEDGAAYLIAAQTLADHAQKDMSWNLSLIHL